MKRRVAAQVCRVGLYVFLAIGGCAGVRAELVAMPHEIDSIYGLARGYWFTAPVDFQITGIPVLPPSWAPNNTYMNWAVICFNGATPPPEYGGSTSDFIHLGLGFNEPDDAFSAVSINVGAGDVIGIYGNTSAEIGGVGDVSYAGGDVTATIFGNTVALTRSGMQSDLTSASSPSGMHDVWQEPGGAISRVEFTYGPVPEPGVGTLMLLGAADLAGVRKLRRK